MIDLKTILIVDDEPKTRTGLKKTLDAWAIGEYDIVCAANGEEAMAILNKRRVHVLVTDIRMPQVSGLQLAKQLAETGQKPVVIIISAYSEFEYAQEAITLGVVNYLLKPVSQSKLIEAVEQAVKIATKREKAEMMEKMLDPQVATAQERVRSSSIKEAIRFIHEHLNEPFSLRDASAHVHLNASYFSVLFKEETNMTFSEYVTKCRVQKAKSLLVTTDLSVEEVAEAVGYQTAKYFIKVFKESESMTPHQFRKQYLKKVEF